MKRNKGNNTYHSKKGPAPASREIALRGNIFGTNDYQPKFSTREYRDNHLPSTTILERLFVILYLCISFAQGKAPSSHLQELQWLSMVKSWQEEWVETIGWQTENKSPRKSGIKEKSGMLRSKLSTRMPTHMKSMQTVMTRNYHKNYGKVIGQKFVKTWKM